MNSKIPAIILAVGNTLLNSYLGQILTNQGYGVQLFNRNEGSIKMDAPSTIVLDFEMIPFYLEQGIIDHSANAKVIGFVSDNSQLSIPKPPCLYGLLESSCDEREFMICVEQVLTGKLFYSSSIIHYLNTNCPNEQTLINSLTKRERQILALYSKKYTMSQIANHLHISQYTVNNHLANIRAKLKLEGPNSLVRFSEYNRFLLMQQAG